MKLLILTQKVDQDDSVLGFFHRWIEEFALHCEKVTVICLEKGRNTLPENVRIFSLGKNESKGKCARLMRLIKYTWKLRDDYDSVFVHMNPEYIVVLGWLWRLLGKKIGLWYTHKSVSGRLRIAEFFANTVFSASAQSFRMKSSKLNIMGHGIDISEFVPPLNPARPEEIITVGRISPIKSYEVLISAVSKLVRIVRQAHVRIVGGPGRPEDSVYEKNLHAEAKKLGLSAVEFMGPKLHSEIIPLLQDSSIFVHMSETGSLDKAVLEAMACGVVVVSSSEAVSDMLKPLGLTYRKKDIDDLVDKLVSLISDPGRVRELSYKMRDYVERNHSLKGLIPRILSYYE